MSNDFRESEDERAPELKGDLEAQLNELSDKFGQVGDRSAGQSGDSQALSSEEDAADHPERPVHTHDEYGRPDDVPPKGKSDAA